MPLFVHRSNRAEKLVQLLSENLGRDLPDDPFEPIPIVVGSRGMERWLRHQIASRRGVAAQLAFPFPAPALDGLVAGLLGELAFNHFWTRHDGLDPWAPPTLAFRLTALILARLQARKGPFSGDFATIKGYLQAGADKRKPGAAWRARDLAFGHEVADVLDRILRQRPDLARKWLRVEDVSSLVPSERWLATLLRDVHKTVRVPHQTERRERLAARLQLGHDLAPFCATVHIFGLSTLPREELYTLSLVTRAKGIKAHLYLLAPSAQWLMDHSTRAEVARELAVLGQPLTLNHETDNRIFLAQRDVVDRREQTNGLLADLGRPSRDVQALLETWADHYREIDPGDDALGHFRDPLTAKQDALQHLQHALLHALPDPPRHTRIRLADADTSITFHPCHGALRQVETLRDELLAAFLRDPTLEPRHVLVMTPDIATYAPLVSAVFAQKGLGAPRVGKDGRTVQTLPAIPTYIADMGLRTTNPVADVLLSVMELAQGRVTLPALLDLLNIGPLRLRFALSSEDVAALSTVLLDAGARWGIDAEDRRSHGQPPLHQNTLLFALERLALGALYLDETDEDPADPASRLAVKRSPKPSRGDDGSQDFVPFSSQGPDDIARFGRLYACVQCVLYHREQLRSAATPGQWQKRLQSLVDELTFTPDETAWMTGRVNTEIAALQDVAVTADVEAPIDALAVLRWLSGRFELAGSRDRLITGAVTVCAMEPMRSVPFRVVALLGMDDGSFPRPGRRRAWDPMSASRRAGEHDRRDVDRHLLLEALLSARDRFIVLFTGYDALTGEDRPPSVLVNELDDALKARFLGPAAKESAGEARGGWWRNGALQPWSEACFGEVPKSFDRRMMDGAAALWTQAHASTPPQAASIVAGDLNSVAPGDDDAPRAITDELLASGVLNPSRELLRNRFSINLDEGGAEVVERSPMSLNALQGWKARDLGLRLAMNNPDIDPTAAVARRWRAEGVLPLGPGAEDEIAAEISQADDIALQALTVLAGEGAGALSEIAPSAAVELPDGAVYTVTCEPIRTAPDPHDPGCDLLVFPFVGALRSKRLMKPWIAVLIGRLAGLQKPISGALLVARPVAWETTVKWLAAPKTTEEVTAALVDLVGVWRLAQQRPVPVFKNLSPLLAELVPSDGQGWWDLHPTKRQAIRDKAAAGWRADNGYAGDGDDRWVKAVYATPDFDKNLPEPPPGNPTALSSQPEWVTVARQVWGPLQAAFMDWEARQ